MHSVTIKKFKKLSYMGDEAINTLCTNLSFAGSDTRAIMVTSCQASEGKSFVTMHVMAKLADLGYSVVLVDADLRRSSIRYRYGLEFDDKDPKGLSHYLAGMAEIDDVVHATDIDGAYIVPVGKNINNALPLLNSPRFEQLIANLRERADYVLVDAPPVGTVIDAAQIAKSCDGSLIVVNYNKVHRRELADVKAQLLDTGCPIIGTALNMVKYDNFMNRRYYYKSYYSHYNHYYTADPDAEVTVAESETAAGK